MSTVSNPAWMTELGPCANEAACLHLHDIIQNRQLTAVFQPILNMQQGKFIGYEGLIRGPINSTLHSPMALFAMARSCGLVTELEYLCRQTVLESFARQNLPGKIFPMLIWACLNALN
jgi:EAL domain-containing protein (putative c-di-GMP-specific phosphodiesterase class I)